MQTVNFKPVTKVTLSKWSVCVPSDTCSARLTLYKIRVFTHIWEAHGPAGPLVLSKMTLGRWLVEPEECITNAPLLHQY